jgi:hypothetical protein
VVGKTIPKGRRGRLLASRAALGGVLTILIGFVMKLWVFESASIIIYLGLLFMAASLWSAAALAFALIEELPGATEGGRNAVEEARAGAKFLFKEKWFSRFLLARATLLSIEIGTPFYVLYVRKVVSDGVAALGIFVVAKGLAQALSSPFWGRFADTSSRKVMLISGVIGAATALLALSFGFLPNSFQSPYLYGGLFILFGISESGVALGRKTYLIDRVDPKERPTFVAFGNSVIGLITLGAGFLGLIAQYRGIEILIAVLAFLSALGAAASCFLPEALEDVEETEPRLEAA